MKAAWYEQQGPARDVLTVGEMPDPEPAAGELRIRIAASGINPGDVKKRRNDFGYGMPYPRIIPHSDGAGVVDMVGEGVSSHLIGRRVWCYSAQSYRPFGTAAEFSVVPEHQVATLPEAASMEQGACLGIPGITAHRAVHTAGPVAGLTILVQGAAGAVGMCAVQLAMRAGARVIGAVRSPADEAISARAGAHHVMIVDGTFHSRLKQLAPDGIDHVIEVAFDANIQADVEILKAGGSIATYATAHAQPAIPFWPLIFQNARLFFLGSDDFLRSAKMEAARDLNAALDAGWSGFEIAERVPLADIARAHEMVEHRSIRGRVVVIP